MQGMHPLLAASASTVVLVIIAIASVVLLALIILAPWKKVRDEPPLDKDIETRILLHRPNPEEPTGEIPRVADSGPHDSDDASDGDYAQLRDLDD
jgi:hypothetical protein